MTWRPSEPLLVWGHAIGGICWAALTFRNPKPWITALYSRGPELVKEKSRKRALEGEGGWVAESLFQKVPGPVAHPSGLS